jgi:hypothetical protein
MNIASAGGQFSVLAGIPSNDATENGK